MGIAVGGPKRGSCLG